MSNLKAIYLSHHNLEMTMLSNLLLLYSRSDKQIQGIRSDRVPEELWTKVHDIVQEAVIKTIPKEKKTQKGKMAV